MSRDDVLTIDPVAMGVVNRIAGGCNLTSDGVFQGGLLIQGKLSGKLRVLGPLVVWESAEIDGEIEVFGDVYVFGQLGSYNSKTIAGPLRSELICHGTIYMAHSAVSHLSVSAQRILSYDGAQIHGPFRTLKHHQKLPELTS